MSESCPALSVFSGEDTAGGGDVIFPTVVTKFTMSKYVIFAVGSHFRDEISKLLIINHKSNMEYVSVSS